MSGDEIAWVAASVARFSPVEIADAHHRRAGVGHDRPHVGEVEVDLAGSRDQVGDALDALAQDVVGHPEGLLDRGAALDDLEQLLVRDDDQRVDVGAELVDALHRLLHPLVALELERLGDDADGQRADLLLGDLGDHGGGAGAGAAALARGDEDHVGALERLLHLVARLGRRACAHVGVGARAEALGEVVADRKLDVGVAGLKRLDVRVDGDELDALEACVHHARYGVGAAAAGAHHLDHCQVRGLNHGLFAVSRCS